MTHLFADGGRIIKSIRCEYADRLDEPGLPDIVRGMMREQHKAMFIALRSGKHDEAIVQICGAFPDEGASASNPSLREVPSRPRTPPAAPKRPPSAAPSRPAAAVTQPAASTEPLAPGAIPPPPRKPTMPGLRAVVPPSAAGTATPSGESGQPSSGIRYVETRPAPALDDPPSGTISIFGGGGDATLDTAILEYIAGDDAKRG